MPQEYCDEYRSLHIQVVSEEWIPFDIFMLVFEPGNPLEKYKEALVACRSINRKSSLFKITFAEKNTGDIARLHKELKNSVRWTDRAESIILQSFLPPKPLTRLTLFPVPIEFKRKHFESAARNMDWGHYNKHTFLTYRKYPNIFNSYVHLFLEEVVLENIPIQVKMFGHDVQIAKPGESFGPACSTCKERGHWTSQCPRRFTCRLCYESGHTQKFCPLNSPIESSSPGPSSSDDETVNRYNKDFPKLPKNQKKSTPKDTLDNRQKPEDLTNIVIQEERKQRKKEKFDENITLDKSLGLDPSPSTTLQGIPEAPEPPPDKENKKVQNKEPEPTQKKPQNDPSPTILIDEDEDSAKKLHPKQIQFHSSSSLSNYGTPISPENKDQKAKTGQEVTKTTTETQNKPSTDKSAPEIIPPPSIFSTSSSEPQSTPESDKQVEKAGTSKGKNGSTLSKTGQTKPLSSSAPFTPHKDRSQANKRRNTSSDKKKKKKKAKTKGTPHPNKSHSRSWH
uniref:ZF(CCHC)-6 zinc finger protein n=1 Tax=Phallusia mammillata TaxID=59560 RepID=A0A6F9DWR1_9ASCI|nr:ZF(CCHC)-6 zinc finger protein [Phallusia mammillata]